MQPIAPLQPKPKRVTIKRKRITAHYSYYNPRPKNQMIGISEKAVYLICSDNYSNLCSKLEIDKNKYNIFWNLLKAYKLNNPTLFGDKLHIIDACACTREELLSYHDSDYIALLESIENYPQYSEQTEEEKELINEHGLVDDCPIFDDLYEYCLNIVGSSLKCAELLKTEQTRIAINMGGGRHHSFSSKASGYCYVNDIILCIDSLREAFEKIVYIDLDLHHCDSIQEAYYNSNNVFVASIHFCDELCFPQTGVKTKVGDKQGLFYNLNIPVSKLRLNDHVMNDVINKLCHRLNFFFQPDCVVVQCGADGLRSDPLQKWNLSIDGLAAVVNTIVCQMDKPTLILGGGGYNPVDTAKVWCKIVANSAQILLKNDIPYHDDFGQFGPHYILNKLIVGSNNKNVKNVNSKKMDIHAMQSIYAHLNNFERLFVQTNLKNNPPKIGKPPKLKKQKTEKKENTAEEDGVMDCD